MFIYSQTHILQIYILSCILESSPGISHGHLKYKKKLIILPADLALLWNSLPQQMALPTTQGAKPETDSQKTQILVSKHSSATY